MTKQKYFYVYYSYEPWGRGYIGKRECWCSPEEDIKYFGSYRDKTFKPTEKIILETFESREDAYAAEKALHNFYEVHLNPHFANKSKITSTGFCYIRSGPEHHGYGKPPSKNTLEGAKRWLLLGKHPSKTEEARKRQSELMKNISIFLTDKNPSKNPERKLEMSKQKTEYLKALSTEEYWEMFKDRIEKTRVQFKGTGNPFYGKTHTEETKKLIGELNRGTRWWNNGKENKHTKECPGEGWVPGVYFKQHPRLGTKLDKNIVDKVRDANCNYIFTFISPDGEIFETPFVRDICEKYDLRYHGVLRVARGERKHYKGWIVTRRPRFIDDK